MAICSKCGSKVGFFSCVNVGGKSFCDTCYIKLPEQEKISLGAYNCRDCSYFSVDSNYESYCRKNNFRVERDKKCCESFIRFKN